MSRDTYLPLPTSTVGVRIPTGALWILASALWIPASALLFPASAARAQQVELNLDRGPHYPGAPIEIQIIATGFEEEPEPEATAPTPDRGRLDYLGVQSSTESSIVIVNGRLRQTNEVRFVYRYRYLAAKAGPSEIGSFTVAQNANSRSTTPLRLELRELELSDRLRVHLELPEQRVFVGQRIPIVLEIWFDQALRKNLHQYSLHVPLFDLGESFQFLEADGPEGTTDVTIETAEGTRKLRGIARDEVHRGTPYLVVTLTQTLIPLRAGDIEIEPSSLVADEATRWRRDFFGGRRVSHARKLRALDRRRVLRVGAIPGDKRPESFAGAVGSGFSLEVSADRSVVKVGDPIRLTFTLRGEGNLKTAGLPNLAADGLLDPRDFRVPAGSLPGRLEGKAKRFDAVVRVENERVREIPALEYSFFDTATQSFETVRSRPIALSVGMADVVDAEDVVSGDSPTGDDLAESALPSPAEAQRGGDPGREIPSSLSLSGADLSIERNLASLERSAGSGPGGRAVLSGLYLISSAMLGLVLVDRRRRSVDPDVLRIRALLTAQEKRIHAAAGQPGAVGVREVADALRTMLAETNEAGSAELDGLLGECDVRVYAPEEARPSIPEDLYERALGFARQIRSRTP